MYTIKQASLRSGVSVPLLRAWERRYGVVDPHRSGSGYRLYDEAAIDRLRAMRALVDSGWSPRQAAERVREAPEGELESLAGVEEAAPPAVRGRGESGEQAEAFVFAAERLDLPTLDRILDEMFASGSFETVVEERLLPTMVAVGEAWARGELDVAGEHAASSAALRRLAMAYEAAGGGIGAPVLVGLPSGGRHELAALAFATAARRAGLRVIYLGADVPTESWRQAVERTGARAVVMGVVMRRDAAAARDALAELRAAFPDLVLAVGGFQSATVEVDGLLHLSGGLRAAIGDLAGQIGESVSLAS